MVVEFIDTSAILAAAVGGIVGTAVGGIVATIWRRRKEAKDKVDRWYRDALAILAQIELAGHRSTTYQRELDQDLLREKIDPLAAGLKEHVGRAPSGVDPNARDELDKLADFATMLVNMTEQMDDVDPQEFYSFIQQESKDRYDGEFDMDDVNQFIDSIDVDSLAGELGVDEEELEVNEEALEEFGTHFSPESIEAGQPTSISEALNMPLDLMTEVVEEDEFWEGMLQDSMAGFAHVVLIEVAGDTYERMEQRKRPL